MSKRFSLKWLFALSILPLLSACSNNSDDHITTWPVNNKCDLHSQSCSTTMDDAQATLNISPHPIPIARPLKIGVQLEKFPEIAKVELDISGVNMYMGFNRTTLEQTTPNIYEGTSMLAFCTTQDMFWQATIMVHLSNGEQIQIPYSLKTSN